MTEFKFEIGDVVRHRVGGEWRGVVMQRQRVDGGGEARYLVKAELKPHAANGSQFASWWYEEFELVAAEPPFDAVGVPVQRPRSGDGAAVPCWGGRVRLRSSQQLADDTEATLQH